MTEQRTLRGNKSNLILKRNLRRKMTLAEKKLWLQICRKQFKLLKFRRQHGIGPFVVDFFCPEKKLAIEVDGDIHAFDEAPRLYSRGIFIYFGGIRRSISATQLGGLSFSHSSTGLHPWFSAKADKQKKQDQRRENFLKGLGIKMKRYTNNDILKNMDGVMEDLYKAVV